MMDPCGALGEQLSDDQTRLDGLSQAHLVGQNAAALRNAPQREHHRVDLMRVGIYLSATLRCNLPPTLAGAAQTHEILGVVASMDGMQGHWRGRVYRYASFGGLSIGRGCKTNPW